MAASRWGEENKPEREIIERFEKLDGFPIL